MGNPFNTSSGINMAAAGQPSAGQALSTQPGYAQGAVTSDYYNSQALSPFHTMQGASSGLDGFSASGSNVSGIPYNPHSVIPPMIQPLLARPGNNQYSAGVFPSINGLFSGRSANAPISASVLDTFTNISSAMAGVMTQLSDVSTLLAGALANQQQANRQASIQQRQPEDEAAGSESSSESSSGISEEEAEAQGLDYDAEKAKEGLEAVGENFDGLDLDGDGVASQDEIRQVKQVAEGKNAEEAGLSPEAFDKASRLVDALKDKIRNKNDRIEFLGMLAKNVDTFRNAADTIGRQPGSEQTELGDTSGLGISRRDVSALAEGLNDKDLVGVVSDIQAVVGDSDGSLDEEQELYLLVLADLRREIGSGKSMDEVTEILEDLRGRPNYQNAGAVIDQIQNSLDVVENLASVDARGQLTVEDIDSVTRGIHDEQQSFADFIGDNQGAVDNGEHAEHLRLEKEALKYIRASLSDSRATSRNADGDFMKHFGSGELEAAKEKVRKEVTDPEEADAIIGKIEYIHSVAQNISGINGIEDNKESGALDFREDYVFQWLSEDDLTGVESYLENGWTIGEIAERGQGIFEHVQRNDSDVDESDYSVEVGDTSEEVQRAIEDLGNSAREELEQRRAG
ncbi:MAG: hypothetical protein VKJ04_01880 [Vampirovibrionales bacterium]|nr:hypothetical protein [Vampirovibrionales bacterium]